MEDKGNAENGKCKMAAQEFQITAGFFHKSDAISRHLLPPHLTLNRCHSTFVPHV
jgi:hypothetical protein